MKIRELLKELNDAIRRDVVGLRGPALLRPGASQPDEKPGKVK
jgi:hypothetical protein